MSRDEKTVEDILRHLYVTAVQDADGVRADRKGYHMRYDEVPAQAKQQIQALITEARIEAIASYKKVNDKLENEIRADERQAMLDALPEKHEVDPIGNADYRYCMGRNNAIEEMESAIKKMGGSDV